MTNDIESTPWICHVCDYRSSTTESVACSVCYKTTCTAHLQHKSAFNAESGLYELQPVCIYCVAAKLC